MVGQLRVYIAGPYTQGDVAVNVRNALEVSDKLLTLGHIPYCPHLTHLQHLTFPRPYEDWMALDLEWLAMCDCVVRLPGESPGADRECEWAERHEKPVYRGVHEFAQQVGLYPPHRTYVHCEANESWLAYLEADNEVDRDAAWRRYLRHLEGEECESRTIKTTG